MIRLLSVTLGALLLMAGCGKSNEPVARNDCAYEKLDLSACDKSGLGAIKAEGIADAKGIQEMNNALAGEGGEAIVKLRIAEAMQGKRIMLLPMSEGGMNLKTTDMNRMVETLGIKSLSKGQ